MHSTDYGRRFLSKPARVLRELANRSSMQGKGAVNSSSGRPEFSMLWSLENLSRNQFRPKTVLDIGAYVGKWTEMAAPLFPESRFFMIEAQPDKNKYLSAVVNQHVGNIGMAICLLGAEEKPAVPFCLMETGSSVFPERTPFKRTVVELPMRRLDDVVREYNLAGSFLLKLDVQGSELQVLRGASETLAQTDAVLLETAFLPYNDGAPNFFEIATFMDSAGFAPYDICGILRRASDQAVFQADFIFVSKNHPLRSDKPFW